LISGAEHQGLVDIAKSVNLGLGRFESHLQLLFDGLKIPQMASGPIEQGHFAGLLVRRGKGILEACIAIPKFVASSLLRLDALLANGLAAGISASRVVLMRLEVIILLVAIIVAPASPAPVRGTSAWAIRGRADGVEAMGSGDGGGVRNGGGRRVSATAAAVPS